MAHKRLVAIVLAIAAATVAAPALAGGSPDLRHAKTATRQFRHLAAAQAAGYDLLVDAKGIACIDMPGMGAMGVHYVNKKLVGNATVKPTRPEALVYEPRAHGRLKLVALEYVVFRSAWDAEHSTAPSLFGHRFNFTPSPNRYGLPAFYSLHAWIWKHNPAGTFAMWNPRVRCDHAQPGRGMVMGIR
jgi:hypothetical protein